MDCYFFEEYGCSCIGKKCWYSDEPCCYLAEEESDVDE